MTKREALRQTQQENTLIALGFTRDEAEALRRISMTLHRWHELECGMDHSCLVRGRWNRETQTFEYDDDGSPYFEFSGASGKNRYAPTRDRERGAKARLQAIIDARNKRGECHPIETCQCSYCVPVSYYIQTDPRGAALYILLPGDVPEGKDVQSYYTRGVCVY